MVEVEGQLKVTQVEFTHPFESFHFQRLMTMCQRMRGFSGWYYAYGRDHIANAEYENVQLISKKQARNLVNRAMYSEWLALHDMGNKSADLLIDNSRMDQGLPPMQRI